MSKNNVWQDNRLPTQFDRRTFLQITSGTGGTIATALLAGCQGGGDGNNQSNNDGGGNNQSNNDGESGERLPKYQYLNNPKSYDPARHDAINLIASQLTELGLDVNVEVFEWGTLTTKVIEEYDFDIMTLGRTLADPGRRMPRFFSSDNTDPGQGNYTGYTNSELEPLLKKQFRQSGAKRADVLHEIQRIITRDVPNTTIGWMPFIMAYNNTQVSGWIDQPTKFNYNSVYNMTEIEIDNNKNELRGASPEPIGSLNVLSHQTQQQRILNFEVLYDRLIRFNEDHKPSKKLSLATDWDRPSKDTAEFTLRDHEWHDGEALTSEDVAFTFDYMIEHEVPVYSEQWNLVKSTKVLSKNEVRINFSDQVGPIHDLITTRIPIIPKHIWEKRDDPLNMNVNEPVGSGPFKIDYWDEKSELALKRNDAHWRPPNFDRRIWRIIPESSTIWSLLKKGTLNYLPYSRISSQLDSNQDAEQISVKTTEGTGIIEVAMNTRRTGLGDVAVRQAINHAIPRTPIIKQLYYGYPKKGVNLVSPAFGQDYNPDVKQYEEGVKPGKNRLKKAEYTWDDDGFLLNTTN